MILRALSFSLCRSAEEVSEIDIGKSRKSTAISQSSRPDISPPYGKKADGAL